MRIKEWIEELSTENPEAHLVTLCLECDKRSKPNNVLDRGEVDAFNGEPFVCYTGFWKRVQESELS